MNELALTPPIGPNVRRGPGRPKGARSKRSLDLARYIEATFAGMTPGQQSAQLCLVTPKDLKEAKAAARELGLVEIDLPAIMLAMAVKAKRLSRAIGCSTADAWAVLAKERMELMPYVHQKQPQAAPPPAKGEEGAVYIVPDGADQPLIEMVEDFDPDELEVVSDKSHGEG